MTVLLVTVVVTVAAAVVWAFAEICRVNRNQGLLDLEHAHLRALLDSIPDRADEPPRPARSTFRVEL